MRRLLRRLPTRLLAALAALVVATSALTAGFQFVFCVPMASARVHCCCPTPSRDTDVISRSCCEDREVPAVPSFEVPDETPRTYGAPLLAMLPLALYLGAELASDVALPRPEDAARDGPSGRLHARNSVFLL